MYGEKLQVMFRNVYAGTTQPPNTWDQQQNPNEAPTHPQDLDWIYLSNNIDTETETETETELMINWINYLTHRDFEILRKWWSSRNIAETVSRL